MIIKGALSVDPRHLYESAIDDFMSSNLPRAQERAKQVISLFTEKGDLAKAHGLLSMIDADYSTAIKHYTSAIKFYEENALAQAHCHHMRAMAYRKQGEYEKSIQDYSATLALNPEHAVAHYSRGYCYAELGKLQLAIEDYTATLKLNPDYITAYHSRAFCHTRIM
jgi:tetratricopeptide (TPR) repeat protein